MDSTTGSKKPRILVVDDDGYNRKLFVQILKLKKYHVDDAASGEAALVKIAATNYDIVVTDLHMFEIGGLEVLKAAKDKDKYTQVIILTGFGSIASAVKAMQDGAYEYLSKPINHEAFLVRVSKALERRNMEILVEEQQKKIDEFHRMIEKDLNLAERVQNSLVPNNYRNEYFTLAVEYLPMIGIGGDFADIYDDNNGKFYLTIIDVTGHGIAAALLVNRVCSEINKLVRAGINPDELLYYLNTFFYDSFAQTGLFLTIHSIKIDYYNKTIYHAGSAHPAALLYNSTSRQLIHLDPQNPIIGFSRSDKDKFVQNVYHYNSRDRLFLYTDGIIETENETQTPFGINGLKESLLDGVSSPVDEAAHAIINQVRNFGHGDLRDDILLILTELT
ncbi:MAG TPA: SpoIIE family protein phosphatase [bacterium]|nr:SpoIIE family protein phosphatase [bacterium]HPN45398.1 SpoIIE family protein phosphatase [bacterium]